MLSALAHPHGEGGGQAAHAAIVAAAGVDEDRARAYYDLVLGRLDDLARRSLELLMKARGQEYTSEFARKYFAEGLQKGREAGRHEGREAGRQEGREAGRQEGLSLGLLAALQARGFVPTEDELARIVGCPDGERLQRWLKDVLKAGSIAELLER